MKKFVLAGMLIFALILSACGGGPGGPAGGPAAAQPTTAPATDTETGSPLAAQLSVYNWSEYIDEDLLVQYEQEYGVEIIYDTFASNEDLLAKLQAGATGYDVIFPSDYMVAQMIELDLLAEIDTGQLSNFGNLDPDFLDAPFDPGNRYCVPYQWGTTGIAYQPGHPAFADAPPDSWAYLFDPTYLEQYAAAGVNVLNDQRELMAAALFYLNSDPNTTDRAELESARDLILQAKPYWKTFNSEGYESTLLIPGEVVLSHAWSGGAAMAIDATMDDETGESAWAYVIPQEGAVKWLDNICIPASSTRQETALHFINFLLEPENAAAITNVTFYASPNAAARSFIDEEILNDPGIFPPEEVEDRLQWLREVGDAIFIYDEIWTAIKGQ
ncbi:MAG: spermidine/putrescine ABC transporter substrate-binding protein [Caldilineaceae bacterium]|nr:spermidine/putrescine ABC transporter substrate-binding protein [Caldilineaceae bacterium]